MSSFFCVCEQNLNVLHHTHIQEDDVAGAEAAESLVRNYVLGGIVGILTMGVTAYCAKTVCMHVCVCVLCV